VYAFSYDVHFTNESAVPVQLWGRHWIIRDATGRVETVRGNGVVGQQPRLEPGQTYNYSSFCPLRTSSGTMEGAFEFITSAVGADEPCVPSSWIARLACSCVVHWC
jgi:ApaG protein